MRRLLVVAVIVLGHSAGVHAASCQVPHFVKGSWSAEDGSSISTGIAIQPKDPRLDRLICLSDTLKRSFRKYSSVSVWVFTSVTALARYDGASPMEMPAGYFDAIRQIHAQYLFDGAKHIDRLTIRPLGSDSPGPLDSEIDLSKPADRHCRFEIAGRCLLLIQEAEYPRSMVVKQLGGSVTVSATIGRDGNVHDIVTADSHAADPDIRVALARSASLQLSRWHFEPAASETPARLTFEFAIDNTPPIHGVPRYVFDLPDRVRITVSYFPHQPK